MKILKRFLISALALIACPFFGAAAVECGRYVNEFSSFLSTVISLFAFMGFMAFIAAAFISLAVAFAVWGREEIDWRD